VLSFSRLSTRPPLSLSLSFSMADDADAEAVFLGEDDAGEVVADLEDGAGAFCGSRI